MWRCSRHTWRLWSEVSCRRCRNPELTTWFDEAEGRRRTRWRMMPSFARYGYGGLFCWRVQDPGFYNWSKTDKISNYKILLVQGSVRTTPDKLENAALFLRLGLPSTLIRQGNGAFRKRSSNWRNLKTPAFRFRVDGTFSKGSSLKTKASRESCDFPDRGFLKHKSKMSGDCSVFKFLRRSVDGEHLVRFQSETSVFRFLRRSVDGTYSRWFSRALVYSPSQPTLKSARLLVFYW